MTTNRTIAETTAGPAVTLAELKAFRRVSATRAPVAVALTWVGVACVVGALVVARQRWSLSPALVAVAVILAPVLAAMQNRLTTLAHDGLHKCLHPSRRGNELLGRWFVSYPVGNFFFTNTSAHLDHHTRFASDADPNVLTYTVSRETMLHVDLPKSVFGLHILAALLNPFPVLSKRFSGSRSRSSRPTAKKNVKKIDLWRDYAGLVLTQATLAGGAFALGEAWLYPYWVACRVTLCAAFNQVRLFVEHHSDVSDATPILVNVRANALERFFIAPLNFNYHGAHHVAPFVPYYLLPELTEMLRERDARYFIERRSYFATLLGRENSAALEPSLRRLES